MKPPSKTSPFSAVLDIETLDTSPTSIITEIAVIIFNRETLEIEASLDLRPNILDQLAAYRSYSADTIQFHFDNGSDPTEIGTHRYLQAARDTEAFFHSYNPTFVWIQGPDFDRPIIESFLNHHNIALPWHFARSRDARSTWATAFPGVSAPKRPHIALEDAHCTLECTIQALKELNRIHTI